MRVGYIGTNNFIVVGFHFHFCLSARVSDYGPVKDTGNKKKIIYLFTVCYSTYLHTQK